ncbi:MAG: DUF2095 family protein [Candidatus Bathyarchaeia archaeon]
MTKPKRRAKNVLPHLMKEIEDRKATIRIRSVRTSIPLGEAAVSGDALRGYDPDVVDFIRRCDSLEQALEIVDFLVKKGELTPAHAEKVRDQLKVRGLRSFGKKKERGYYFRITGRSS